MPAKILIVDDQADIRRLVRWTLEEAGHTLFEAANGALGVQLAQTAEPDIVLLDVMMPGGMDGIEACKQMRASPHLNNTLIVMLTADSQTAVKTRAQEAGANVFLGKPFSPAKLGELIEALLRKRDQAAAAGASGG